MKKGFFTAVCFCLLFAACAAAGAEKKSYTLGFGFAGLDTNYVAQIKLASNESLKGFEKRTGIEIKLVLFNSDEAFLKAAEKKQLDFIFIYNSDLIYKTLKHNDYKPFMGFWTVLPPNKNRQCFWVKKDGNIKTVRDAKGSRLGLVQGMEYDYLQIYKLTGNRPEVFFKGIQKIPNFASNFYALALGKVDVIFQSEVSEKFMEMTNPGTVKDIRVLACAQTLTPLSTFFRIKTVPEADAEKLLDIMKNWRKDKIFSKYRALLEAAKADVMAVTEKDYKPLINFFDECIKKGWDKDYQRWVKIRK